MQNDVRTFIGASGAGAIIRSLPWPGLTIVFGDSFASGEGAPYRSGAKWDNELCHRSGNSGQARAVRARIDETPAVAITFRNVACSGAQIAEGILLSQPRASWILESLKPELQAPVRPQIAVVRDWLAANGYAELHIAMVSGGGNDVDFARFVETYLIWPNVPGREDEGRDQPAPPHRADRYFREDDRRRFVAGRHLIRTMLAPVLGCTPGDVRILIDDHGRPDAAGAPSFSLSHSGNPLVLAIAHERRWTVGIDIEAIRYDIDPFALACRICAPVELDALRRCVDDHTALFFRLWTLEEAVL